jgi:hypothetical protein
MWNVKELIFWKLREELWLAEAGESKGKEVW